MAIRFPEEILPPKPMPGRTPKDLPLAGSSAGSETGSLTG